jgi:two-component system copper resistance phosphate regulon response regulator CusR
MMPAAYHGINGGCMRILLVEDEADAAAALAKGLRDKSFAVDIAEGGREALRRAHVTSYDLMILDVRLPDLSGLQVCKEMRGSGSTVPIIMLTALGMINDRINGLDCGADDYLSKPFDFGELLARIRALLRRGPVLQDSRMQLADLVLDTRSHRVQRGDEAIELTAREYALLEYLVRNAGKVVGRAEISEHVWDENYDPFSNLIEVYVQRLRRKVDRASPVKLIHTRRGEGYLVAVGEAND